MGSFSFRRADHTTKQCNFLNRKDVMRVMIPTKFVKHYGCTYFEGTYLDYGHIKVTRPDGKRVTLDLFGFLAYINGDMKHRDGKIKDYYKATDGGWSDTNDDNNRCIGISIGCYPSDHVNCKYPLKLCSATFEGTYEDAPFFSDGDHAQGCSAEYWDDIIHYGEHPMSILDYTLNHCIKHL